MSCSNQITERLERLATILEDDYGREKSYEKQPSLSGEPDSVLGTLIITVLSQASNDERTRTVYERLRDEFANWHAIRNSDRDKLEGILRPGGLATQKAGYLKGILESIYTQMNQYSLQDLKNWTDEEAYNYLISLPGVGKKTATCVLLFALERDVFPVDTHVARISRRLGFVEDNASADKIHNFYAKQLPSDLALGLHLNLLEHGRQVCLARTPRCWECSLFDMCGWEDKCSRSTDS